MENKDPIKMLADHMVKHRIAKRDQLEALQEQIDNEVIEAIEFGRNSPLPPAEQAYEDLYA